MIADTGECSLRSMDSKTHSMFLIELKIKREPLLRKSPEIKQTLMKKDMLDAP